MDDHKIEQVARRLGARAGDRLDVEAVAAGVVARLRGDRTAAPGPARLRWNATVVLRAAAAVAVLAVGGLVARDALKGGGTRAAPAVEAPILSSLSSDELEEVFDSLAVEAPVHEFAASGLQSLNETQLQELLQQMEG
jgi:hypothetical protein